MSMRLLTFEYKSGLVVLLMVLGLLVPTNTPVHGQDGDGQAADMPADQDEIQIDGEVADDDYSTFDIAVQDTDLAEVLQMLSIQSRKNIITSKNVSKTVTANLYDVTFHEALDVILHSAGYGYIEEGNFVYIYTIEELAEIEKLNRKRESRRFELEHLSAVDANEFIQPMLSGEGKSSFVGKVDPGFTPDIADGGADSWAYTGVIVVNDYPDVLDNIAQLLYEIDTPPAQVMVEATVVSTDVNEATAFGVDFSVIGGIDFSDLVNPLSAVTDLLIGDNTPGDKATKDKGFQPANNKASAITSSVGQTQREGGFKVGFIRNDISVFLRVLDEVTDATVLARPRVLALNRQRASVLVGERVGYLSTTTTETTSTQTVEYLDTGISLIFRPFISRDGTIRMELAPSISSFKLRDVSTSFGNTQKIPDQFTNEVTTNVRLKDGETVVLGGLFQEIITNTKRQVPYLGDIPLLGEAFKGHDDTVDRQEIIFLITPRIVNDRILAEEGEEGLLFSEIARVGAREGLLPFSREYITSNHNQDAMEAIADGNDELAMFHINNSLRLSPQQGQIRKLKHELSASKPSSGHQRGFMDRVIDKEIQEMIDEDPSSDTPEDQVDPLSMNFDPVPADREPEDDTVKFAEEILVAPVESDEQADGPASEPVMASEDPDFSDSDSLEGSAGDLDDSSGSMQEQADDLLEALEAFDSTFIENDESNEQSDGLSYGEPGSTDQEQAAIEVVGSTEPSFSVLSPFHHSNRAWWFLELLSDRSGRQQGAGEGWASATDE